MGMRSRDAASLLVVLSLGAFSSGCASRPSPPQWAVQCGLGESWDRRSVATTEYKVLEVTLWESSLAASGEEVTTADIVAVDAEAGMIQFTFGTASDRHGICSAAVAARRLSAGEIILAIIAARVEASTGVPAQTLAPGLFGHVKQDAYGAGIHADQTGRPVQWVTPSGEVVLGPVEQDAYGPGIGQDQFGRPVRPLPLD